MDAIPITGNPNCESSYAPACVPLPPMMTSASILSSSKFRSARARPSGVLNSCERALPRNVPPNWMTPPTSRARSRTRLPKIRPSYPSRTPNIFISLSHPARTTARIAAFIPGASPPLVKTAIRFIAYKITKLNGLMTSIAKIVRAFT